VLVRIVDLDPRDADRRSQEATLLVEGFRGTGSTSWPDLEAALNEVAESLQDDKINLAAVDDSGAVVGWIGGIRKYDGHAWELHPLVVKVESRGQGVGRALVASLEQRVGEKGGITIYLGTDDESFRTSVSGKDLYPNVLENLLGILNPGRHPYGFYQKVGFTIVGAIPDANGWGKPDIFMAKRVGSGTAHSYE
jgi:aminoglycoside 6'-N-acetyltransferase I